MNKPIKTLFLLTLTLSLTGCSTTAVTPTAMQMNDTLAEITGMDGKACLRTAYIPFSTGRRVCPGAGFAMAEGPLLLSMLVRAYRFELCPDRPAMPVAHLTVRGRDGIWLRLSPREMQ